MKEVVSKLRTYLMDEQGDEAIEKIIIIGAGVVLAIAVIGFFTFRINQGASEGANKAKEAGDVGNITWSE